MDRFVLKVHIHACANGVDDFGVVFVRLMEGFVGKLGCMGGWRLVVWSGVEWSAVQ